MDIEKEVIVKYLKSNPEELKKLIQRYVQLKPLAVEFARVYYLLQVYGGEIDKNLTMDPDIKNLVKFLEEKL